MARAGPPEEIVARLRRICGALPETVEEQAWVGTRWRVRKQTFAHVLHLEDAWPPAYAKVVRADGPLDLLTFRSHTLEVDPGRFEQPPFFRPMWWPDIAGMTLDADTDWDEAAALIRESYCVMAPKKLAALVSRPA